VGAALWASGAGWSGLRLHSYESVIATLQRLAAVIAANFRAAAEFGMVLNFRNVRAGALTFVGIFQARGVDGRDKMLWGLAAARSVILKVVQHLCRSIR
jgi:hypothetical protein